MMLYDDMMDMIYTLRYIEIIEFSAHSYILHCIGLIQIACSAIAGRQWPSGTLPRSARRG